MTFIPTGIVEFDRLIGGGLVFGSTILFGGYPGAGKSTLCIQIADSLTRTSKQPSVLFASGEQDSADLAHLAQRIGCASERVEVLTDHDLRIERVLARACELQPALIVVDTLHSITTDKSRGKKGSTAQIDEVVIQLTDFCRRHHFPAIVLSHMNARGALKVSNSTMHRCNTILVLAYPPDGDPMRDDDVGLLYVEKNRHGQSGLVSYWRMTATGMMCVPARKLIDFKGGKYKRNERDN